MRAILDAYLSKLKAAGAAPMQYLAEGASADDLSVLGQLQDCEIPDHVTEMWSVFNGMTGTDDVAMGELWLDGTFMYFSADEAVEDYQVSEDLWENEPEFEAYLPKGFLPIGTPGDGSRLLVNCRPGSPTHGSVYELFHGIGLSKHAASLKAYFETVSALFDAGAVFVDDDGCLDIDADKGNVLAAQMNAGCDAYADDLPPASVTKDWLGPQDEGMIQ